ncbi:MAG: hypothetical protein ACREC8_11545 [Limisphaerales bacterium]
MRRFIILAICVFVQAIAMQAIPSISEGNKILALIKNLHLAQTSLAYRSAAVQQMLEEANYFSEHLKLPPPHPIRLNDLQDIFVSAPWFSMTDENFYKFAQQSVSADPIIAKIRAARFGAGGNLQTTNFSFSFARGRLFGIENRINHDERFSMYATWARTPSLINTNGAYQLATQWLAAVDIDVAALNKKYRHKVEQRWFWNQPGFIHHPPGDTNKTMLPIYEVTWGAEAANHPAFVQILGTTKELMKLHLGDLSLSRRPLLVITNAIKLNNIPDPPIKQLKKTPANIQTNSASP